MIGQMGRLARVAQLGWKSGKSTAIAERMGSHATNFMREAKTPAQRVAASQLRGMAIQARNDASLASKTAQRYSRYVGVDNKASSDAFKWSHDVGKFTEPVVTPIQRVAGTAGGIAMDVMNNPVGQMGLFVGAPMLMMGGGESAPPESYQDAGMIVPAMTPPDSYQQMYSSSYGVPATPQLDEEQIRRARKRAEEQAALQQFYAQALTQYQG